MTDAHRDDAPSRWPWPPILLVAAIIGSGALQVLVPWPVPLPWHMRLGIGGLSLLGGLLLMALAVSAIVRGHTTIRPDRAASHLVTDGPFRYSRNPIYVADVLLLAGTALLTGWMWLVAGSALFVACVTQLAIRPEEAHLAHRFGEPYRAYCDRVRRWL